MYLLPPVPYSIGNADEFLAKTDKSKSFLLLTKDTNGARLPLHKETLTVYKGNAMFHCLKDLPTIFGQINSKSFDTMSKDDDDAFSTDHNHPVSIKAMGEEEKRYRREVDREKAINEETHVLEELLDH